MPFAVHSNPQRPAEARWRCGKDSEGAEHAESVYQMVSAAVALLLGGGRPALGDTVKLRQAVHELACPRRLRGGDAERRQSALLHAVERGAAAGCDAALPVRLEDAPADCSARAAKAGRFAARLLGDRTELYRDAGDRVALLPLRRLRRLLPELPLPELDAAEAALLTPKVREPTPPPDPREGYTVTARPWRPGSYGTEVLPKDAADAQRIVRLVAESNVHNLGLEVVAVERVVNPTLEAQYREVRAQLVGQNPHATELSFHGTPEYNIDSICSGGFRMPDQPGMFGRGVYFASNSSKCVWFVEQWNIDAMQAITEPVPWPRIQRMLVCELAVGRYKEMRGGDYRTERAGLRAEGFDSVKAIANSERMQGCRYEEWMIYHQHQVFPRYIVHFHKTHLPLATTDPKYCLTAERWVDSGKKEPVVLPAVGVVIGKFMPPHAGHAALIRHASGRCQRLNIVVCESTNPEHAESEAPIDGQQRIRLLQAEFPANRKHITLHFTNDLSYVPRTEAEWRQWGDGVVGVCADKGFGPPDIVFGGEPYVARLAEAVAESRGVDPGAVGHSVINRESGTLSPSVSATELREHGCSADLWDAVLPGSRSFHARKVCLYGCESVGKTTLARQLAEHYKTAWAPEYAREYLGDKQVERAEQMAEIAAGQLAAEEAAMRDARRVVFCDTDLLTTRVYGERYFGGCADWVREEAARRQYDLYLFLQPDVPWEDDPLRDLGSPASRKDMQARFEAALAAKGAPHERISGSWAERFERAVAAVDAMLRVPLSRRPPPTAPRV